MKIDKRIREHILTSFGEIVVGWFDLIGANSWNPVMHIEIGSEPIRLPEHTHTTVADLMRIEAELVLLN